MSNHNVSFYHLASDNPGPAAYDLGTTIGKAVAKSISSRQPEISSMCFSFIVLSKFLLLEMTSYNKRNFYSSCVAYS